MIIAKAKNHNAPTRLVLSRSHELAVTQATKFIKSNSKNPLVVAFGSVEFFKEADCDVARIDSVANLQDDVQSILSAVSTSKYDGILVDSITLLLRFLRTNVAGVNAPTLQEYGIINYQLVNVVLQLRNAVPVFTTTAAFVLDEDKTKKANGREVWELDLTSNLRASLLPVFGEVHYVANDGTVVEDTNDALLGKKPANVAKPSRPKARKTIAPKKPSK